MSNEQYEIDINYGAISNPPQHVPRNTCAQFTDGLILMFKTIGHSLMGGVAGAAPAAVTTLGVLAAGYPAAYGIGCAVGLYDKSTCTTDQLKDGLSETTMWGAVGAGALGFFAGAGYAGTKAYYGNIQLRDYADIASTSCRIPLELVNRLC